MFTAATLIKPIPTAPSDTTPIGTTPMAITPMGTTPMAIIPKGAMPVASNLGWCEQSEVFINLSARLKEC